MAGFFLNRPHCKSRNENFFLQNENFWYFILIYPYSILITSNDISLPYLMAAYSQNNK